MIRCRVLGSPDLTDDTGQRLSAILDNPRRFAVLAFLAVEARGVMVARDTLAAMFWPNLAAGQARLALRRALLGLRRDLGADVVRSIGATRLIMNPDRIACDATDFERALRESRLERALEVYRTGLLDGVALADGFEFNVWLARKRAEYTDGAFDAAMRLGRDAVRLEEPDLAIKWLNEALTLSPASESAKAALIAVLNRESRVAAASSSTGTRRISYQVQAEPPAFLGRNPRGLAWVSIARVRAVSIAAALLVAGAAWLTWQRPLMDLADFGSIRSTAARSTSNPEAFAAYQQGVASVNQRNADGVARAIGHFEKAILLDSTYALAYAGLSKALQLAPQYNLMRSSDALPMSRAVVLHALRLDPSLPDAHASLGYVKMHLERDWPAAEAALRRAIALKPGHARAYHYLAELGSTYQRSGRRADAARVRQSIRADQSAP